MLAEVDQLGAERDRLVRESRVKYAGKDKLILDPQMRIGKKLRHRISRGVIGSGA
jgi:hypothetical protein